MESSLEASQIQGKLSAEEAQVRRQPGAGQGTGRPGAGQAGAATGGGGEGGGGVVSPSAAV